MSQNGQIAVVILLFALVALTIGLAVTQRSLTSITTSAQTEQASRAFSAAEAGIESAKSVSITASSANISIPSTQLNNQSQADAKALTQLPKANQALEYPPIGKDTIAQFWLANPGGNSNWNVGTSDPGNAQFYYGGSTIYVYFGSVANTGVPGVFQVIEPANLPALEVNLITFDGTNYHSNRSYYDSDNTRRLGNGFTPAPCLVSSINTSSSLTSISTDRNFLCRVDIPIIGVPIMIRARLLYSDLKQALAVGPSLSCITRCSLPQQAAIYTATGLAGSSQKTLQVFREINFMPTFLDFAIFSSGQIVKQ